MSNVSHIETEEERQRRKARKKAKKKNRKITKAHPEFELTYDMMLGIRTVVSEIEASPLTTVRRPDFLYTRTLKFPKRGSSRTPAHQMRDFKFKDYCPAVFRQLRVRFKIHPAEYLLRLCGDFEYLEFISNSKSGQFFFYTHDTQYMIKTMTKAESLFLRSILPEYYEHIMKHPNSLMTRFYGMHRVKPHKRKPMYFLIMGSVFGSPDPNISFSEIYDLKGSTYGRRATDKEKEQECPVLKDVDMIDRKKAIEIGPKLAQIFKDQLKSDTEFLERMNIMDYSVLVGVYHSTRETRAATLSAVAAPGMERDKEHEEKEKEEEEESEEESEEEDEEEEREEEEDEEPEQELQPMEPSMTDTVEEPSKTAVEVTDTDTDTDTDTSLPNDHHKDADTAPAPARADHATDSAAVSEHGMGHGHPLGRSSQSVADAPHRPSTSVSHTPVNNVITHQPPSPDSLPVLQRRESRIAPRYGLKKSHKPLSSPQGNIFISANDPIVEKEALQRQFTNWQNQSRGQLDAAGESKERDVDPHTHSRSPSHSFSSSASQPSQAPHPEPPSTLSRGTSAFPCYTESDRRLNTDPGEQSAFQTYKGGVESQPHRENGQGEVYFMGIIDILQKYNRRKKIEHAFKGLQVDAHTISCVSPKEYAKRMCDFIEDKVL